MKKLKLNVFFATNNPGKITDAKIFAQEVGVKLLTPENLQLKLNVDETGDTYEANALLKAEAFKRALNDPKMIVIADDGGIEIPTLNNEPGVHSRRWKGYSMTDQEIIDYCLERLQGKTGAERDGSFITVLAVLAPGKQPHYFRGVMKCHITEQPIEGKIIEGFPFRSLMYIPEIDKMIYDLHGTTIAERSGFMTHREKALQEAFAWIADSVHS
jgi:XTP/dITP diphosphohydrolase